MARISSRIPRRLDANRLATTRAEIGHIPFDLTVSNPTMCGFELPDEILATLADPRGSRYTPEPRGPRAARQAVADSYLSAGTEVDADQVLLTASTSEAYAFLFKTLADPGETILFPSPSYPLFDTLARLEGLNPLPFTLDAEDGWRIDFPSLEAAPDSTRAVVVVHPNNPTGSLVGDDDRQRLITLAAARDWALIVDEVFLPFVIGSADRASCRSFADTAGCLCFSLGGFSKALAAPQLKLAWLIASGPREQVARAQAALDYVADAYLSVSSPVALATPQILRAGRTITAAVIERCRSNLAILTARCREMSAVTLLPPDGGWSAVVRVPSILSDEALALELLGRSGVAVHPGYFFDIAAEGYLVLSLLPAQDVFDEGVRRLLAFVDELCAPG